MARSLARCWRFLGSLTGVMLLACATGCSSNSQVASTEATTVSTDSRPSPPITASTCDPDAIVAHVPSQISRYLLPCSGALHEGVFPTIRVHRGENVVLTTNGHAFASPLQTDNQNVVTIEHNVVRASQDGEARIWTADDRILCDAPTGLTTPTANCVLIELSVSGN